MLEALVTEIQYNSTVISKFHMQDTVKSSRTYASFYERETIIL